MSRRVLAVICARAGSKGLRHKNVRKVGGVPLLVRAVRLALASRRRDEDWTVVVSTDSARYGRLAQKAGATVVQRPARLATDTARLADAVIDAVQQVEGAFDVVLLLSATTPLTTPRDVRRLLQLFWKAGGTSVASVRRDPVPPSWRFELRAGVLDRRPRRHHVGRRQQDNAAVLLNGALYAATPAWLLRHRQFLRAGRTLAYAMPAARSLDIESLDDLREAARRLRL